MKALIFSSAILLSGFAHGTHAQAALTLDGASMTVPELMQKCREAERGSQEQLDCFDLLALAMAGEEGGDTASVDKDTAVAVALESLRAAAEYQDDTSGLRISSEGCLLHTVYYGNYYRISRRNVSTVDMFSAKFDISNMAVDQTTRIDGAKMSWYRGTMTSGAAIAHGGAELDSSALGFEGKSANMPLGDYATQLITQLPATEAQQFDFVIVHPQKNAEANQIWGAFQAFAQACQS